MYSYLKNSIENVQYFAANAYMWPGGYPMYALCADGGILCHTCMKKEGQVIGDEDGYIDSQWHVIAADINYEDPQLYCDHCGMRIESAYSEDN